MARGTCHDVLALVPQKDAEASTVADTGRAGIELVQSVLEKLDVRARGLFDLEAMHLTPIVCLTPLAVDGVIPLRCHTGAMTEPLRYLTAAMPILFPRLCSHLKVIPME